MPSPNSITIKKLAPALQNLILFFVVLAGDLILVLLDIYLESGGAKIALPMNSWSKEVKAVFALIGIPHSYISPSIIVGLGLTIVLIAGSLTIAHYTIQILSNAPRVIYPLLQARREGRKVDGQLLNNEIHALLQVLIITVFISIVTYGYIFPKWSQPLAQIQIAHKIWPSDFQVKPQGDSIIASKQTSPDMRIVLERHDGEFSARIVTGLPTALLMMHILFAFLTEVYLLHTISYAGQFEERNAEVVHRFNEGLVIKPLNRIKTALVNLARQLRRFRKSITRMFRRSDTRHENIDELQNSVESTPSAHINNVPVNIPDNGNGDHGNTDNTEENGQDNDIQDYEDELSPEEQPVRVIGGGEFIAPEQARRQSDFYVVEEERDDETGELYYRIYTREFYEDLQKQ